MKAPIVANQIQFSLLHCPSVDAGFRANMEGNDYGDDVLSYCQFAGIPVQAWSVLSESFDKPCFIGNPDHAKLNQCLEHLAEKYGVSDSAIAIAWIMRHPAGIIPVVGTTRADRLEQMSKATEITLERQDWYDLYLSTGKILP